MSSTTESEQFADAGANLISALQRELDNSSNLTPDQRAIFTRMISQHIELTARWVQAMKRQEQDDLEAMFWGSPAMILACLRKRLSPGQIVQLARTLLDDPMG